MSDGIMREKRTRPHEHPTGPTCKHAGGLLSCRAGVSCLPAGLEGALPQAAVDHSPDQQMNVVRHVLECGHTTCTPPAVVYRPQQEEALAWRGDTFGLDVVARIGA